MVSWLIDERPELDVAQIEAMLDTRPVDLRGNRRVHLAMRLNDVVVHDTRKLFGGADVRLDTIIVHGPGEDGEPDGTLYQPRTFRFSGVRDGDRLPIEHPGLLTFYGRPRHFLDIAIIMSRDRKDTADLSTLITENLNSEGWQSGIGALAALSGADANAAAIMTALGEPLSWRISRGACWPR